MVETTTAEQTERVKCFDANLVVKQGEAVLVRVSRRCSRQISSFLDLRFLSGRWKLLKLIEVNVTDSSFKNKKLSFSVLDRTKKNNSSFARTEILQVIFDGSSCDLSGLSLVT